MKHLNKLILAAAALTAAAHNAQAADISACEVLTVQNVQTESGEGQAQAVAYLPADDFIASVQDETPEHLTKMNDIKIRALMCTRDDLVPAESDYDFLATGIPLVLSQDFDSPDTDSLTMFWTDGQIEQVYKGHPLSAEAQLILDTRIEEFSERGISAWAIENAKAEADAAAKREAENKLAMERALEAQAEYEAAQAEYELALEKSLAAQVPVVIPPEPGEVIPTAKAATSDEIDEMGAADAAEIDTGDVGLSEATKLNLSTSTETEE